MKHRTIVICCAVTLWSWPVWAEQTVGLDLNESIRIGVRNNLKLRNAAIDMELAGERALTAEAVFDPQLSLRAVQSASELTASQSLYTGGKKELTDAEIRVQKTFSSGTKAAIRIGQNRFHLISTNMFPIPPYSARISLSVSQSILKNAFGDYDRGTLDYAFSGKKIAEHLYAREKQLLIWRICETYWDLYADTMNYKEGCDSLDRAVELLKTNRARFEDGLLDETDILAAEALIATREAEILALSNNVENAADYLRKIIRFPLENNKSVQFVFPDGKEMEKQTVQISVDGKTVYENAKRDRADLSAMRNLMKQVEIELMMKRSAARPDLKLFGDISRGEDAGTLSDSLEMGDTAWTVGLELQVPFRRKAEKSEVRQARLRLEKARNNVTALEDEIALECRRSVLNLTTAYERVTADEKAMNLHKKKLVQEKKKFEQGRSATHVIIQFEDDSAFAQMSRNIAMARYMKALAFHGLVQGHDPVAVTGNGNRF